jgi:hypothetical protein
MPTIEDGLQIIAELPDATEGLRWRNRTWFVADQAFAWGASAWQAGHQTLRARGASGGPLLAVRVADLAEEEAAGNLELLSCPSIGRDYIHMCFRTSLKLHDSTSIDHTTGGQDTWIGFETLA